MYDWAVFSAGTPHLKGGTPTIEQFRVTGNVCRWTKMTGSSRSPIFLFQKIKLNLKIKKKSIGLEPDIMETLGMVPSKSMSLVPPH